MSGSEVAAIAAAPAGQDVRKRWLLLAVALVVGLVAAFAIGSAVKKSSAPNVASGSLAQSSAASAQHANITPLTNAAAVPALHAPPKKPKAKPKTTASSTSPASSSSSSSVASTPVSSSSSVQSAPVQSSTPVTSSAPTQSGGGGGGGGTSSGGGTSGVSHGGGGG